LVHYHRKLHHSQTSN